MIYWMSLHLNESVALHLASTLSVRLFSSSPNNPVIFLFFNNFVNTTDPFVSITTNDHLSLCFSLESRHNFNLARTCSLYATWQTLSGKKLMMTGLLCVEKPSLFGVNKIWHIHLLRRNPLRKSSNFNFQWTKTLYQKKLRILHPFKNFSRAINVTRYLKSWLQRKGSYGSPRKQTSKASNFHKMKTYVWRFYLGFLKSCEIWNLFSRAPIRNCS